MEAVAASTEIWVLGWSAVLLLVQVVAQATAGSIWAPPTCSARATKSASAGTWSRDV